MKSLEELKALCEKKQGDLMIRYESKDQTRIVVGLGTSGIAAGAKEILIALSDAVQQKQIKGVAVVSSGSFGKNEPVIEVVKPGEAKVTYGNMDPKKALEVLEQHVVGGKVLTQYTIQSENK